MSRGGIVVLLGIGLLGIGGPGAAAASGAAAGADNPEAELIFNAGIDHLKEGRPDLAIEEFDRALKKDPKNPYFHKGLAVAYLSQNKVHEAIGALRKALDLNPYYVDARNDLGTALLLDGQREEGKKELIRAYDDAMNPTPEVTSRNLGRAYLEEKDYDRALSWFRKSVQRNKRYPDGQLGVADALIAMGKVEDAVAHLEAAVIATGDHTDVVLALGEAYYRAGRFVDARRRLELVVQKSKDPASPSAQRAAELLKNLPR